MGKDRAMESKWWKMDFCQKTFKYSAALLNLVCRTCLSFVLYCIWARARGSELYFTSMTARLPQVESTIQKK